MSWNIVVTVLTTAGNLEFIHNVWKDCLHLNVSGAVHLDISKIWQLTVISPQEIHLQVVTASPEQKSVLFFSTYTCGWPPYLLTAIWQQNEKEDACDAHTRSQKDGGWEHCLWWSWQFWQCLSFPIPSQVVFPLLPVLHNE